MGVWIRLWMQDVGSRLDHGAGCGGPDLIIGAWCGVWIRSWVQSVGVWIR